MSAAQERASLFDPAGLLDFADADQVVELTEMFTDQMTERLPQLRAAIADADSEAIYQLAHGLKGSAATIGAPMVMKVCDGICRAVRRGEPEAIVALQTELAEVWSDTAGAITASLRDLPR